jgi:[acyl-carrier-protein] S-malonyltransferase
MYRAMAAARNYEAVNSITEVNPIQTHPTFMTKAYMFPGQGSQKPGMGKALQHFSDAAKQRFKDADAIMGFDLSAIMADGDAEDLKQTRVTQPALFVHSVVLAEQLNIKQDVAMVAGHSLGELSALAATKALTFEDGLNLVKIRAEEMQVACDQQPSTMAAIVGLGEDEVEQACAEQDGVCVAANYNAPGQVVISGEVAAVRSAMDKCKNKGAKMAKELEVSGAFHSPLMESAREKFAMATEKVVFAKPLAPVYQNVTAQPSQDPDELKANLIAQLTAPVRWRQTIEAMHADGATDFIELGPGKVLQGLAKRSAEGAAITGFEQP